MGGLVADAVGLGKTYIGLSLLERELLTKRKRGRIPRGLIICPAQLRDLVWRPRLAEYGIPVVDVLSQEEIGRADFDWKRYRDLDVVVVDESHDFRNPNTNRYRNLMKLLTGGRRKRVILMTATPVNNSLYDFYYQLLLLARGEEHFYRQMGINNLRSYVLHPWPIVHPRSPVINSSNQMGQKFRCSLALMSSPRGKTCKTQGSSLTMICTGILCVSSSEQGVLTVLGVPLHTSCSTTFFQRRSWRVSSVWYRSSLHALHKSIRP